jgi:hypothetical protein
MDAKWIIERTVGKASQPRYLPDCHIIPGVRHAAAPRRLEEYCLAKG